MQIIRMIVCVCHRLCTKKVEAAIEAGAKSPREVHAYNGVRINCGKCCQMVGDMLRTTPEDADGVLLAAE